jgi:hypothetical protein
MARSQRAVIVLLAVLALAVGCAGELFTFRWSLYRGVLTLYPVNGAVSPPTVTAKPWLRVSTSPSPHFLSSRCPPPAGALPQ